MTDDIKKAGEKQRKALAAEIVQEVRADLATAVERTKLRYGFAQLIVTTIGSLLLAWIAFQQAALSVVGNRIEKNTNHLVGVLIEKTEASSHAEGVADEKARRKAEPTPVPNHITEGPQ